MSEKINDGKTAYERYQEKFVKILLRATPEKAQDIKDCAALAGLSVNAYLLMCHENYQQSRMNND